MATFTNIRLGMRTKNSLASSPTPRKLYQSERVTQTAEIEKLIRSASHLVQEAVYARLSRLDSSLSGFVHSLDRKEGSWVVFETHWNTARNTVQIVPVVPVALSPQMIGSIFL